MVIVQDLDSKTKSFSGCGMLHAITSSLQHSEISGPAADSVVGACFYDVLRTRNIALKHRLDWSLAPLIRALQCIASAARIDVGLIYVIARVSLNEWPRFSEEGF